ncbi:MAG: hypothetical protein Phog2KO_21680 [Phototrophicaceae bacterium]
MKYVHYLWGLLFIIAIPAMAQESCSADIIRALSRAGSACTDVTRNHVCYGNGDIVSRFDSANQDSFALVGERAQTGLLQQLIVDSTNEYSVTGMQLQLSLLNTQPGRNVSLLAFGNVTLTNQVPVRPTILVESTGLLTLRASPSNEADIIEQYPLRTTVTANGLYSEGGWLRVEVPNTSEIAWVLLDIITTNQEIDTLNIVDVDTPFLRSFQIMTMRNNSTSSLCDDAPPSGMLLQSPNTSDAVEITINGLDMLIAGTIFLETVDDDFILRQIEGQSLLRLATQQQWIVSGSEISVTLDSTATVTGNLSEIEPFDSTYLARLPLNSLNYRVGIPTDIVQSDLDNLIADLTAIPLVIAQDSMMSADRCIRTANGIVTLYAGTGTFYEVIRDISSGTILYPVLQLSDSDGVAWWQLSNGHWMVASRANIEGNCNEIPLAQVVDAPSYNTLILETCDTTNGPIRAGQWVQIEFTHGSWRTLGEAQQAVRIDRGQITLNQQSLWVEATQPRQVAEESFYRTFYGSWYAETGTYRIVGGRLSYSIICDITVPVG